MKHSRWALLTLVTVGLVGLSGFGVWAWMADSGTFNHEISAEGTGAPEASTETVWVCKLVGSPDGTVVASGKNPIRVSVEALDENGEFPDPHGSYVVEEGDECVVPDSLRDGPSANTTTTVPAVSTTSTTQPGSTTTTSPGRDRSPATTVPATTVPRTTVPATTVPATTVPPTTGAP